MLLLVHRPPRANFKLHLHLTETERALAPTQAWIADYVVYMCIISWSAVRGLTYAQLVCLHHDAGCQDNRHLVVVLLLDWRPVLFQDAETIGSRLLAGAGVLCC
jgi:hypothetical protein